MEKTGGSLLWHTINKTTKYKTARNLSRLLDDAHETKQRDQTAMQWKVLLVFTEIQRQSSGLLCHCNQLVTELGNLLLPGLLQHIYTFQLQTCQQSMMQHAQQSISRNVNRLNEYFSSFHCCKTEVAQFSCYQNIIKIINMIILEKHKYNIKHIDCFSS